MAWRRRRVSSTLQQRHYGITFSDHSQVSKSGRICRTLQQWTAGHEAESSHLLHTSHLLPMGRSLTVICCTTPSGLMMKRPRCASPSFSIRTPYRALMSFVTSARRGICGFDKNRHILCHLISVDGRDLLGQLFAFDTFPYVFHTCMYPSPPLLRGVLIHARWHSSVSVLAAMT